MNNFDKLNTQIVQLIGSKEGSISPTITPSASYGYEDCATAEAIFDGSVAKPLYARMGNPTNFELEKILATLEDGIGAIVTSSGMGAISMVMISHLKAGDEIICLGGLFGGSFSFFTETLSRFGITTCFFDVEDTDKIEQHINHNTKIIFMESVGNPSMSLIDISRVASIAKKYGLITIVDNTLTPLTLKPLQLGADIVVYSTTKLITGNASSLGGAAIFKPLKSDDPIIVNNRFGFYEKFFLKVGSKAMVAISKKRALRDFGMSASAFNSYLVMLGLETLPLRIERINKSVQYVVEKLSSYFTINHPSIQNHKHNRLYLGQYNGVCGNLFTIDFKTKEKAFDFLNQSKLITITANVSDTRTLGLHMASTIYRDFDEDQKRFLGITEGLVRISIGHENPQDIVEDFLAAAKIQL